jgi:hypothetical protein
LTANKQKIIAKNNLRWRYSNSDVHINYQIMAVTNNSSAEVNNNRLMNSRTAGTMIRRARRIEAQESSTQSDLPYSNRAEQELA